MRVTHTNTKRWGRRGAGAEQAPKPSASVGFLRNYDQLVSLFRTCPFSGKIALVGEPVGGSVLPLPPRFTTLFQGYTSARPSFTKCSSLTSKLWLSSHSMSQWPSVAILPQPIPVPAIVLASFAPHRPSRILKVSRRLQVRPRDHPLVFLAHLRRVRPSWSLALQLSFLRLFRTSKAFWRACSQLKIT